MEAHKLNLLDYQVQMPDGKSLPYRVKDAMCEILMNPQLKLNGSQLLKRDVLGQKILQADGKILLSSEEWGFLRNGVEAAQGFSKNDVELVKRILEAEKVEVNEK